MAQISLHALSIGFRGPALLDGVSCRIEPGERIGLLGRNGAGKTTLLRILAGQMQPDAGELTVAPGTRVWLLPQDVPAGDASRVSEIVGRAWEGCPTTETEAGWWRKHRIERILAEMQLDGATPFQTLSSGMKRRVLLAQALVASPDVLLLDEPTNHLDIESIDALERRLLRRRDTLVFVTHDRVFLRKLATRILEVDRGRLFDWACDYDTFLQRKEAALAAEEKQNAQFDRKLAQEEAWIRQGIRARRTRNEGRVRALERMRRERSSRRSADAKVRLQIDQGRPSGNLVVNARDISFAYDDRNIVHRFSTTIMRGDKVGIVGRNGAGKTTLLRLLLGEIAPQQGSVRLGTRLSPAYFDQMREQLDEEATVEHNVADGYDAVFAGGKAGKSRHLIGYLGDFLFSPERARTPVRFLSGGERNRVLLARLFAKPANVIVMDEPTNDLDTETLELLEQRLVEFQGTVLLVSHDREFLNHVVTSTIAFEADGVREYDGGYDDWQRAREASESAADVTARDKPARATARTTAPPSGPRRLTYKEQQELAGLPERIDRLESEIAALHHAMADSAFYQQPREAITDRQTRLKQLESELASAYERWELLDQLA
jgi:ABC transport system ATP-binding/permease protein